MLLRMIQRLGKVDEVGERGDNCWRAILELGSEEGTESSNGGLSLCESDGRAYGTNAEAGAL